MATDTRFRAGTLHYGLWGLLALVGWLLVGELGIAVRERWAQPIGLVVLRNVGASDTSIALLLSTVPAVISLLLVPAIGLRSDRCRSPWGRRRPYLLVSAPLGAGAMLCVAAAPALAAWSHALLGAWSPGLRALDLGFFCLFWTVFEAAAMTTVALFNGLVNDVMPHGLLGRLYAVLRIAGLGVAIFFNMSLFALADTRLFELLLTIALVFGLSIPLMCLMVREGVYPAPAAPPVRAMAPQVSAHTQLLQCCTQRRHLWAFGAFMLAAVTFGPFNTFSQNYALGLGLSKAELGTLTATGYAVSIASAFGIGWLADRFGSVRVATVMMGLYSLIALGGCLLVRDGAAFRGFYLAHVVVSGAYFTAAAAMPMDVFPRAEFVRYNASKDIMVALASILVGTSLGPLLDLSGHDYRLTLASAALFSLLCLGCLGRLLVRAPITATEAATEAACTLP
ncbi:MFS transporter [Herbaspirillum sp. SJZ107]|uniref:MFS transporter n=1 Tax=Herbaspirillum sp. SJZ107 TaxID=2572881 RepID=UPI00115115F6|nr:MFS transporter [Herbaspirillum sp. SJZ107]TQK04843.1 MFS transporter [Herbaspirillum sp. SJZ107]